MILPALKSLIVPAALVAVGFAAGAGCVRYAWQAADLAAAKEQAEQMANLADQLRKMNEEKDAAITERDSAMDALRVRDRDNAVLADKLRKQSTSAVPNAPSGTCQRHLAECRGLLSEGAQLVAEGSGLVGRLDADRAAVRKLTQPRP